MRPRFDRELQRLQSEILRMGSEVEEHLTRVTTAFVERDDITASQMIAADSSINERRIQIALDALALIATQQPLAKDLRLIAAVLEIVGELERIHDYIKGIGKISLNLGPAAVLPAFVTHLPEMAETAREMLHLSLKAFVDADEALAQRVPAMDNVVDTLFNQLYADLVAFAAEQPQQINYSNQLEWALHNLERSADRTINICEWVVYMVSAVYHEMSMGEYEAPPAP